MTRKEFEDKYENGDENFVELIANEDNKSFNVFKVLGLTDYEIRHSNFLAWLLQDSEFFKQFAKLIGIKNEFVKEEKEINREEFFYEVDKAGRKIFRRNIGKDVVFKMAGQSEKDYKYYTFEKVGGKIDEKNYTKAISDKDKRSFKQIQRYIDINIIGKSYTITIENKLETSEHDFQCRAYKNYIETKEDYKEKKHYFIFLAKNKPEDFPDEEIVSEKNNIYEGYKFIDYNKIRKILENSIGKFDFDKDDEESKSDIKTEVVEQYKKILSEWEKVPQEYKDILKKMDDLSDFSENKKYQEILSMNPKLNQKEQRFVELARSYYLELKKETDEVIKPAIEAACADKSLIDPNYNNGKYGLALRMSPNKGKNEKVAFQTVDYRAPMEGDKNPNIAIFAGLSKDYSIKLCELLIDDKFLNPLNDKKLENWSKNLILYFKNGSGFNKGANPVPCDYNEFNKLKSVLSKEILNSDKIHGTKSASDVFNNDFMDYLKKLNDSKLFNKKEFSDWLKDLVLYFTKHDTDIETAKQNMESCLAINDYKNDFKNWKKNNIKCDKWKDIISKIVNNFEDTKFDILDKAIDIDLFKKWINSKSEEAVEILCNLNESYNLLEKYENHIKGQKQKNIVNQIKEYVFENKADGKTKIKKIIQNSSDIPSKIIQYWLSYSCCSVLFGWNLVLKYEISNFDKEYKDNTEKLKELLIEKTKDGVTPFGKKYLKWCEDVVFNKKES